MEAIGIIGIVAALVFFIVMAMRGYSVLITAPIAASIMILANGMDFTQYLLMDQQNSFMAGMGNFVFQNGMLFILSSIIGKFIEMSGAASTIAQKIMGLTGDKNPLLIMIGVAVIGMVLTYGGVSLFVVMFALIPIARPLFKACNLPWHLFMAAYSVGATGITMCLLPGSPSLIMVITTQGCGTTLTAAAGISIICCILVLIWSFFYLKYVIKKSREKGEVYDCKLAETELPEGNLPGFAASLTPLIVLIAITITGSILAIENIVLIAMAVAVILSIILFVKNVSVSEREILTAGAADALQPLVYTASGVGLGSVAAAAPGFMVIADLIYAMPGGPLLSAAVMAFSLGAVSGGGMAAASVLCNYFVGPYLASGVSAGLLAKVIAVAACTGGALPNAGPIFGMTSAMGLTVREAYKHIFWVNVVPMVPILAILMTLGPVFGG